MQERNQERNQGQDLVDRLRGIVDVKAQRIGFNSGQLDVALLDQDESVTFSTPIRLENRLRVGIKLDGKYYSFGLPDITQIEDVVESHVEHSLCMFKDIEEGIVGGEPDCQLVQGIESLIYGVIIGYREHCALLRQREVYGQESVDKLKEMHEYLIKVYMLRTRDIPQERIMRILMSMFLYSNYKFFFNADNQSDSSLVSSILGEHASIAEYHQDISLIAALSNPIAEIITRMPHKELPWGVKSSLLAVITYVLYETVDFAKSYEQKRAVLRTKRDTTARHTSDNKCVAEQLYAAHRISPQTFMLAQLYEEHIKEKYAELAKRHKTDKA